VLLVVRSLVRLIVDCYTFALFFTSFYFLVREKQRQAFLKADEVYKLEGFFDGRGFTN
jgi:hypothetical protein